MSLRKQFDLSIIGHRGFAKNYPENTLLGFQKAIDVKADYIEFDVHSSADGVVVICHDSSTKRTGNAIYTIHQTPFETLRTLDMGKGEKMPTFQETIDLCKGKIGFQIEIKEIGLADKVVELIQKNGIKDQVGISSFHHEELRRVKELDESIMCAALLPTPNNAAKGIFTRKIFIDATKAAKADGFHPFYKYINEKLVKAAKDAGMFINAWTVDNPQIWKKLRELQITGIITNDPLGLHQFLAGV
jgi:glycerophosphoryl diester phosphodiesterase